MTERDWRIFREDYNITIKGECCMENENCVDKRKETYAFLPNQYLVQSFDFLKSK